MTDPIHKPVWRMNSGSGVPSDLGVKVCYSNGLVAWTRAGHWHCNESWDYDTGIRIAAYQTNRTKAAKYKKQYCWPCDGLGHLKYRGLDVCPYCQGHKHTWELL